MLEPLRERIANGMPVLGTCAGLILLAERVEGAAGPCPGFGTLPVTVRRNAYGRQLGSFTAQGAFQGAGTAGNEGGPLPMTFIRAPKIVEVGPGVEVLASVGSGVQRTPAAVRFENQIGCAFHPELDGDPRVHRLFLEL